MKLRHLIPLLLSLAAPAFAADNRQMVTMPLPAQEEFRGEMRDFMAALHQIISSLAEGKLADAADTAEQKIGTGAMGRHRGAAMEAMPGRYMPQEMHALARTMHFAATDFARAARSGDQKKALELLPEVTARCTACHLSYRIR